MSISKVLVKLGWQHYIRELSQLSNYLVNPQRNKLKKRKTSTVYQYVFHFMI